MFKRFLGMLCLMLICSGAFASVSLRMEGGAAMVTADGETVVAEGEYDDIVFLGDQLFAARKGNSYVLINQAGESISTEEYDHVEFEKHAIIAEKDGLLGLINGEGEKLSEFRYSAITPDPSGMCWALYGSAESAMGMKLFILSGDNDDSETEIRLLSIGKTPYGGVLSARAADGKYGYIDRSGKMIIEAQYQYASDFVNGCAAAATDDRFGAIDTSGAFIIPAEYDFLEVSEYGYIIAAQAGGRVAVFNLQGELLDEYFGENISISTVGRYYAVCDDISLRVYTDLHEMLFEAPSYAAVYEGIGEQLIISDGLFGENCVRIYGTDNKYQNLYPLGVIEGEPVYACVSVDAVKYENHMLGESQYSLDMNSVRYGAVDSRGEVLLESKYLSLVYAGEDRLLVQTENEWQMIDIRGEVYWSRDIKTSASPE